MKSRSRPEKIRLATYTLVSIGIMGSQMRARFKPLNTIVLRWSEGFQKGPQLGHHGAGRQLHWENYISISFPIEWDMIVVRVFLSILDQMGFHLVKNRKENRHHDHIPFNVKENGNIVFSVHAGWRRGGFGFLLLYLTLENRKWK